MTAARLAIVFYLIAGLINFVPISGVLGDSIIEAAYGIDVSSPELSLLLRHRAVLFGIVGGMLLVAAFRQTLRPAATLCGLISMTSFAILYTLTQPDNDQLLGVLRADLVGILILLAGWALHRRNIKNHNAWKH